MSAPPTVSMDGIRSVSQISPLVLERLLAGIPLESVMDGIKELLGATFITKSGKEHPDYRAREAGIKLYMSYLVGLPVQRQIIASVSQPRAREDAWAEIRQSPAARAALRKMLDDADGTTVHPDHDYSPE